MDEQVARLREVLFEATKRHVMQPLWRQAPVVVLRYASETLGISGFRLRGLFGTEPLARTLARAMDWDRSTTTCRGERSSCSPWSRPASARAG